MSIETWKNVCDLSDSIIKDGHVACKRNWFASVNLLGFLDLPLLDPIDEALPPKLHLEQIENEFTKSKEWIQDISQLHLDQIKECIESPLTRLINIDLFL